MALVVQKYGGTSIGTIERIKKVAERVGSYHDRGDKVIVVVSAMSGETDKLINYAYQITDSPLERELDMLISTGEQVSIALLAMAIHALGYEAKSFAGHQVRITTDSSHTKARIVNIDTQKIEQELAKGKILIIAGFQGVDENEEITTLGRGGSDTTGVAIAAAIKADICEIYTDVDGVYTTDPNIVPNAKKIEKISYDEMLELASLGAKVLQIRSVEFASKYNVNIAVRSSFNHNPGTLVTREDASMEKVLVRGVTYNKNESKVTVKGLPDKPGVAARVFDEIAKANIIVDMIIQNTSENGIADISFTVPKNEAKKSVKIISDLLQTIGASEVKSDDKIAKISLVGLGMKSHTGIASKAFNILAKEGINILMITTSEIAISCVIEEKYTELAVRVLHDAFELEK
ncbi:MAG: aspartate kinase [bacterium]